MRLPIFCDVAGSYKGTSTDGNTWIASVDPYTGITNVSVQSPTNTAFSNGIAQRTKDAVTFILNLPDGAAWRGKFILSKGEAPTISGNFVNFDGYGKFNAVRESFANITCSKPTP